MKRIHHHLLHLSKNRHPVVSEWCKLRKESEHLVPSACAQPLHLFRLRSKFFIRREESTNAEATTEFSKQSSTVRSPPRPTTSILYSLTPSTKVSSLSVLNFQYLFSFLLFTLYLLTLTKFLPQFSIFISEFLHFVLFSVSLFLARCL